MLYICTTAGCKETFTLKGNRDKHIKKFHPEKILPAKQPHEKIRLKLNLNPAGVTGVIQGAMTESLVPIMKALETLSIENRELKRRLDEQRPNITINNTVNQTLVYNCFNQHSIDLFKLIEEKYGASRAMSYANQLMKGKTKANKHAWILDQDLGIDMKSLGEVVNYDSGEKDPCFNIKGEDQVMIQDKDGSQVDRILTDIVRNAGLKAFSYVVNRASGSFDSGFETARGAGDGDRMWEHLNDTPLYDTRRNESIYNDMEKFKKIPASKPHLLKIIPVKITQ
jgi:hypothetical protein